MDLNKWINLIKKDLKEEIRVGINDPEIIVELFLEEILKEFDIKIDKIKDIKSSKNILNYDFYQILILVNSEKEEDFSIVEEIRKKSPFTKILIVLNFLKEKDIGRYFEEGVDEVIFKPFSLNEFRARLNKLFKEYYLDKKLQKIAIEDGLTGVYNRRFFDETLKEEVYKALRQKYPLSLIMIDLDNFKWYNDNLGHQTGDKLLKKLGRALISSVRDKIDKVCRYGGDEFTIILPYTSWKEAVIVVKRICKNWEKEKDFKLTTLSIGIAQLIKRGSLEESLLDLLKRADKAMYQAKKDKDKSENKWKVDEDSIKLILNEAPQDEVELFQS